MKAWRSRRLEDSSFAVFACIYIYFPDIASSHIALSNFASDKNQTSKQMRPLKIGLVFGLGAMFGVLVGRSSKPFQCHRTAHHGPSSCHRQPPTKAAPQEDLPAANN
ncbi:hypothetical protein ACSQ67_016592 [Phaseolus vulgaris]|uniref:Uncharacterized protein n=1 Tax=Phaseolus vulgaris TaxID=3885 RepID=V7B4Q8_PHAVU|nr:hypothetical protein PHAVU_008G142800g [Phaseolus vulgaris]ESW12789.1 hypothetical protein PHAVU_008G142800g [Phaseolus vulgaris]